MKFKMQLLAILVAIEFPMMALAQEDRKDRAKGKRPDMPRPGFVPGGPGTPGGGGVPGGPMALLQMLPIMKVLDTDQDGTLSATEIANASKALMQLDKDGDGVISAEEMRPDMSKLPGGLAGPGANGIGNGAMMGKMFETRDANGDGKLTGDEIPERMRDRLSMVDKDGDGSISKSEFAAMAARMEDGAGKRPGKDGKDGNGGGGVKPKRPTE